MALDYHTAQEDFSVIVEKLPPMFLANFVMWLDLKVAEYKVFGQMVLDGKAEHSSTRYMNLNRRPGMFQTNTESSFQKDPRIDIKTAQTEDKNQQSYAAYPQGSELENDLLFQRPKQIVKISTPQNPQLAPENVYSSSYVKKLRVGGSVKSPPISRQLTSQFSVSKQYPETTAQNTIAANSNHSFRHAHAVNGGSSNEGDLVLKVEMESVDQLVTDMSSGSDSHRNSTSIEASTRVEADVLARTCDNDWHEVETDDIGEKSWTVDKTHVSLEDPAESMGSDCSANTVEDVFPMTAQKHLVFRSPSQFQSATDTEIPVYSKKILLGNTNTQESGSVNSSMSSTNVLQHSQNFFRDEQAVGQTESFEYLQSLNSSFPINQTDFIQNNDKNHIIKNKGVDDMQTITSSMCKKEQTLECPLCPAVLKDNREWLMHHKSDHASMCSDCHRVFKSWKNLRLHVMTAHKQQTTGYFCKYCGKRFTQQQHYRGHVKSHHGIKEFRCENCNQAFTYRSGLTIHMRKCGGLVGDYKCTICQKDFLRQCHLKEHISGMHSETPRYTCQSCGEKFLWREALSRHKAKTCHK